MLDEKLNRAIERFDLESYIRSTFSGIRSHGDSELSIDCFSCGDSKKHLYVNVNTKRWQCFKCGYGSNAQKGTSFIPRFIADAEGISIARAIEKLTSIFEPTSDEDLELALERIYGDNEDEIESEIIKEKVISLPDQFFKLSESKGLISNSYRKYSQNRGFNEEMNSLFDVRFCVSKVPSLSSKYQFSFAKRIIWPIYDQEGVCRSAVARDISSSNFRPRWINWPDTDLSHYFWPLSCILPGGIFKANMRGLESVVLTEGIVDAHAVNTFSDHQAFACFGKKLSDAQIALLHQNQIKEIILAWDFEAKKKMIHTVKNLAGRFVVKVFPFLHSGWSENDWDLGDTFNPKCPFAHQNQIQKELDSAIDVESLDYCRWINS